MGRGGEVLCQGTRHANFCGEQRQPEGVLHLDALRLDAGQGHGGRAREIPAGLYKLNAVDPKLESVWFQPLNL